jgi:hypothetical protein
MELLNTTYNKLYKKGYINWVNKAISFAYFIFVI